MGEGCNAAYEIIFRMSQFQYQKQRENQDFVYIPRPALDPTSPPGSFGL